jgi:hypothetical protein
VKSASRFLLVVFLLACKKDPHVQGNAQCAQCHLPESKSADHPPHENARRTACGVCHTQKSWRPWRVDHPGWELTGAHLRAAQDEKLVGKENQVKCFWCHRGQPAVFEGTKKECIYCHDEDRGESHYPGHDTFPLTCGDCHSTDKWKPATKPEPAVPPPPKIEDAGVDAGHDAGIKPKPVVIPKPPPPKPPPTLTVPPPDIISRPSRRH